MRLVHNSTGEEVKVGDRVKDHDGHEMIVTAFPKPHSPASSGHIYVKEFEEQDNLHAQCFYCSVFDCEWIEREDRDG